MVAKNPGLGRLNHLRFRDPASFVAGNIHRYFDTWESLFESFGPSQGSVDLLGIVREGVKIDCFFQHFKGHFKGKGYDSSTPPHAIFKNSKSCLDFYPFISETILKWVSTGVLAFHGKVGHCKPPHLVVPLTVEPSKPRLCHDERFLNLWIRDLPFKLDHLPDLPRYVFPGNFQTVFDDMNGYQHVSLHPDSQTYFGLVWEGCYFTFRVLPFGWKASAYLFHNLGLVVSSAARSFGVPLSQYIDDRHVGQLLLNNDRSPSLLRAQAAAYILCYLLIEAGYFIGLPKCQSSPSTTVRFLGLISDSVAQAFLIPLDKKEKFASLREEIIASKFVSITTLQRFAGKAISFSLAIPGCKLYVRGVFGNLFVFQKL